MSLSTKWSSRAFGATLALIVAALPVGSAQAGAANHALRAASPALVTPAPSFCTLQGFTPNRIVLGASKVKTTLAVKASGCVPLGWVVALEPFAHAPDGLGGLFNDLTATQTLNPRYARNSEAGKSVAQLSAVGDQDVETDQAEDNFTFTLLRRSSFGSTFNASPEPLPAGQKLTIKGTLTRIDWNGAKKLKYVGYAKAKVQVQFRADGGSDYATVKTVTAAKGGKINTTVTASKSGSWRLFFPGSATTAPATSTTDAVTVG